ncbi:MAG TPA: hypothetical protein VE986_02965 [Hyphomicrobiales bacterium]|nr:hypothetical protein [Hyphomicrobiales bacterium]
MRAWTGSARVSVLSIGEEEGKTARGMAVREQREIKSFSDASHQSQQRTPAGMRRPIRQIAATASIRIAPCQVARQSPMRSAICTL